MRRFILYLLLISSSLFQARSLQAQVAGRVAIGRILNASDSLPISSVTVRALELNLTAKTDAKGNYELSLASDVRTKLVLSCVGFELKEIDVTVQDGRIPSIFLNPLENVIEEVTVNTGYQKLPKERSTGSFEFLDEKLFNRQIGTDVLSRLDGILPTVLFDKRGGSESNMVIRGVSSLGSAEHNGALIVVDNFPFEGDINSINPNDVESVTLLKDAAAASIWGAKAGNGVIVITTKRGRFGTPWRLSFKANSSFVEKPDLYYMPKMSSADFIDMEHFLYNEGAFNSILNNTTSRPPVTPVVALLHQNSNGGVSNEELARQLNILRSTDVRTDLDEYFYRTGYNQQYAFSVAGGGKNYNTHFSAGYDNNARTAVGNRFSRVNLNLQNTFQLSPKFSFNVGMRYSKLNSIDNSHTNLLMSAAKNMYPYADLVDTQGKALVVVRDYNADYLDAVEQRGDMLDWRYRPFEELALSDNSATNMNMLLTSSLEYQILNNLTATIYYQFENQPSFGRQIYSEKSYYTRNLINRFTRDSEGSLSRAIPLGGILDKSESELNAHSARGQLAYTREWSTHSVSAILGGELRDTKVDGGNTRQYGYNSHLATIVPVDYISRHPIYDDLAGASSITFSDREYGTVQRFVSTYINGSYTYDKKYTLSLSARRDASNLFGVATNDKWSPLWSVGGAWDISKEDFFNLVLLPKLKLRATYGYNGNVRNDIAAVTTLKHYGLSRLGRYPYAAVMNPPNSELRWEKIRTLNLGLDFSLVNNILSGSIEYYDKRSTDLLSLVTSDPTTGFGSLTLNSAIVSNKGIDLSLNSNVNAGNFGWSGTFLASLNRNRVVEYLREPTRFSQWVGNGGTVSPIVGEPAYTIVSYRFGGLDPQTGDPVGYLNGQESKDYRALIQQAAKDDLKFHGSALPEFFGAFRNTFRWKDFSASFNVTYRTTYYFRRQTINYSHVLTINGEAGHGDFTDRWQKPGDERSTSVPSMTYPADSRRDEVYRDSEATVERGDHIRFQDFNVVYSLAKNDGKLFKDISLSFYARNLGIIWSANKKSLDPDVFEMPLPKTYSIGISANF